MSSLSHFFKSHYIVSYLSITAIILTIIINIKTEPEDKPKAHHVFQESVDTIIPAGFTLYPIEISNFEALNALVGSYAIVNIYQISEKKKSNLILQRVKIIRSPKDPRYFAALLKHKDSEVISNYPGPFKVTIQNPKKPNKIVKKKFVKKSRVIHLEDQ